MTTATPGADLSQLDRRVVCLLGLPFDVLTLDETLQEVRDAIAQRRRCWLSTPNLNFLIAARQDPEFRRTVLHSELSVADGMPIVWLARLLGLPLRERVAGSDVFEALHHGNAARPVRAYFFGGPDGAAEAASRRINALGGGLHCVGFDSPGFGSLDSMSTDAVIERINATQPDFVVVSLGAKKGQAWIERNRHRLMAPVIGPLGAVVNFEAGTVRRAPPLWRRLGLEWLWRIMQEPALWRRYAGDARALLPMLWGSVLPLWWARVRRDRHASRLDTHLEAPAAGAVTLRLRGVCVAATVPALRQACKDALALSCDLRLDLQAVEELDAEAMGLLLLVQAHQQRLGRGCAITVASPLVRRRLRQHGCADLLKSL
ncbi:WecB/TagA/CpsF family glycosyltransferase [Caldimonas caldifontis]|uniref:N-acetylglucosaminyldiphospho-UDP N-acetyl-beta-D-mannosaminyltransferase n=1 Tax=Caldimonas caldifontis TaxID=1452508 RepID=A0A2S5SXK2_9BURK|nr:WecB/TagA/CpsF family glycosyltransferase [Caldimonas caldifontis]PPE67297.1 N-acetylglucosaminyldiphospho-UDP N-acetyl-beta-D-mannosaminyltransferase [Caldimonas caldifontis]